MVNQGRLRLLLVSFFLIGTLTGKADNSLDKTSSPLLDQFYRVGVEVAPEVKHPLPPPLLIPNDSLEQRKVKLEQLSARHGWPRFSRSSAVAPVHIELGYIVDASGNRVGHHVYCAYIVYAALSDLRNEDLMESLVGNTRAEEQGIGFEPERVPSDVLQAAGIVDSDEGNVRYSTIQFPLMNRVSIGGTARIEAVESDESIVVAWQLDPQFTPSLAGLSGESNSKFMNRYVKSERDELGRELESEPLPYMGCGGYVSVQETGIQPGQLLVESRLVLHEPTEWFAGSNFLRSKFPSVLQESAQTFRRKAMRSD